VEEEAMYLQEILEVAIGLVLVWLIISVATMSLQEWLANILNSRARELEKAITQMLSSRDLTRQFYEYPLIANLYTKASKKGKKARLPSYISDKNFSATLFELVIRAGTESSPVRLMTAKIEKQLAAMKSPEQKKLAKEDWEAILETAKNIAASGLGSAALDSLKFQIQAYGEKNPDFKASIDPLIPQVDKYYAQIVGERNAEAGTGVGDELAMRQFRLGMLALEKVNPNLKKSITAIIRQAETSVEKTEQVVANLRVNLETWFNDAMDRLSGAYKRRAQLIAFIIGFIVALILNVDTIRVATSLWREPTLRQAIVAQAEGYAQASSAQADASTSPFENIPAMEEQLKALNIPFGWMFGSFDTGGRPCSLLPVKTSQAWGMPSRDEQGQPICEKITDLPKSLHAWLIKILGLLITGLAAAQGAPFWFDILKKLVNVRGTGTKPDEPKK
jgi:hypothetical protein